MTALPSSSPCLFPLFFLFSLFPSSLLLAALSHSTLRWSSAQDPCYQPDSRPRHCLSEFINAAYSVPVQVAHTLGGPEKNVSFLTDLHNPNNLSCWLGEELSGGWTLTVPLGRRFEVTYVSLQFCQQRVPPDSLDISVFKSMDHRRSWRPLQFYSPDCMASFGMSPRTSASSRHQETEPFCSDPRPLQRYRGGLVLAFSTLDGRPSASDFDNSPVLQDWVTATDIRVVFHQLGGQKESDRGEGRAPKWWAESELKGRGQTNRVRGESISRGLGVGQSVSEQDFVKKDSTIIKAGINRKWEKLNKFWKMNNGGTHLAKDGQNMTRKGKSRSRGLDQARKGMIKGKGQGRKKACSKGECDWTVLSVGRGSTGRELRRRRNNSHMTEERVGPWTNSVPVAVVSGSSPSLPALSLSDLQVGGRCKCNGHASRCHRDAQGRATCQCEHHTAGPDCDTCEPFYCDRPWQRATPSQPHPCVPCECHGHSSRCRFSMQVFQQSGRRSGGICLKCQHHTAGRNCQYCDSGFFRDHSKPLNHRRACRPCQCHPVGAVGRWCNQTSGQCLCREGVIGVRCSRCAPGYQQGRSPIRPCLRIQEVVPTTPVYQPQYSIGEECTSYCQPSQVKVRMNLETYCLKDYGETCVFSWTVIKVQIRGMERSGPWWQFSVLVQSVFRVGSSRVRRGVQAIWVPDRDLGCGCPALQVGRTFLLVGAEASGQNWGPEEQRLVADRSSLALPWREHWSPKLRGFRGQDKRGRCPARPLAKATKSPPLVPAPNYPPVVVSQLMQVPQPGTSQVPKRRETEHGQLPPRKTQLAHEPPH